MPRTKQTAPVYIPLEQIEALLNGLIQGQVIEVVVGADGTVKISNFEADQLWTERKPWE